MTGSAHIWGVRVGAVAWFVAGAAFLLSVPVLIQAWLFLLPIIAIVAFALAMPLAWLWSRLARRPGFPGPWLKTGSALLFLLSVIVAAPVYYFAFSTQLRPALVPQVSLTNGPKTIVIQGMQHVGTDRFFRGVVFDMEEALARGDILFYEGVRSSDPASARWFADTVADGQNLTGAYREIGSVCGLTVQNDYLKVVAADAVLHPDRHVTADVTTAELKQEYDRLMVADPAFAAAMRRKAEAGADTDGVESILNFMTSGSAGQREIAGVICRGIMTQVMLRSNDPTVRDELDPLILDFRNRVLAQRLLQETRPDIYVTYGAKHIPGVFALLKASDPRWRVAAIKWVRTIDSPETYDRVLPGLEPAP
ncbi:hypothetical protein MMB232_00683 [Brevundimonas subvibrioides]|uniref:hypothetical protein n=1 Tax=Brevundimonas subvibrioides TaxID=74313 RepID=UPI0032D57BB6